MTQWYYVDARQQRHGPVDARAIGDLFRAGTLTRASLVWREGMQQWTALVNVAPELRLDLATAPPPAPEVAEPPSIAKTQDERPLTGRAVFTASEPAHIAPATLRPESTIRAGDSPYAAPRADIGAHYATPAYEGHVVYAGFWKRVAASLIDVFALGIPIGLLVVIIGGLLGWGSSVERVLLGSGFHLGDNLLSGLLTSLAFAWFHSSAGLLATPGKLAIGIKVVRGNGEKISFLRGFGRYWAYLLSSMLLGIGVLMAAFTSRKQGLHDFMCDTLVVDKWAFTSQPERQRDELGTVATAVLVIGGLLIVGALILILVAFGTLLSMAR